VNRTRSIVYVWLFSRVATFLVGVLAVYFSSADRNITLLQQWVTWDAVHYEAITRWGYQQAQPTGVPLEAFLPGFPLLLRLGLLLTSNFALISIVVNVIAGGFAAVALARLADAERNGSGTRAVAAWLLAPSALFLFAPYPEALFAAFAFWGWVQAKRGHWAFAAILVALASLVRINGLFLAVALIVAFLSPRFATSQSKSWKVAPFLALPFVAMAGYVIFLWRSTGSWSAWFEAQKEGWDRELTNPIASFERTWRAAFGGEFGGDFQGIYQYELFGAVVIFTLFVVLLIRRLWPEAVYVGLTFAALATSSWYFSMPRMTILLFPLWVLASIAGQRRWVANAYVIISVPFAVHLINLFVNDRWAG
jgi:Gpi18-like mannosyltransferase